MDEEDVSAHVVDVMDDIPNLLDNVEAGEFEEASAVCDQLINRIEAIKSILDALAKQKKAEN